MKNLKYLAYAASEENLMLKFHSRQSHHQPNTHYYIIYILLSKDYNNTTIIIGVIALCFAIQLRPFLNCHYHHHHHRFPHYLPLQIYCPFICHVVKHCNTKRNRRKQKSCQY